MRFGAGTVVQRAIVLGEASSKHVRGGGMWVGVGGVVGEGRWRVVEEGESGGVVAVGKYRRWIGGGESGDGQAHGGWEEGAGEVYMDANCR
jgi:hypothetical protein